MLAHFSDVKLTLCTSLFFAMTCLYDLFMSCYVYEWTNFLPDFLSTVSSFFGEREVRLDRWIQQFPYPSPRYLSDLSQHYQLTGQGNWVSL